MRTVALLFVLSSACASYETISVGGREREYLLHVPENVSTPSPLVFILHGRGGNGRQMRKYSGFDEVANARGWIVVYPSGFERSWNDGRDAPENPAQKNNIDDLAFFNAIIEDVAARHEIDRAKIFAAGMSNGGMMSSRIACDASDVFAAVAPVAASIPEPIEARCRAARPISVMLIHGTADTYVPYAGGSVMEDAARGTVLGVERSIALWRELDGCDGEPEISEQNEQPDDETSIRREKFSACTSGKRVELVHVEGGGHTWPGATAYDLLLGVTSEELSASEVIGEFFAAQ